MADLEQQYRRALRWYPKSWRQNHEEAFIGLLLDQAEASGRKRMSQADRRDLLRHGARQSFTPLRVAIGTGAALLLAAVLVWPVGIGPCHTEAVGVVTCNGTQVSAVGIYLPNLPGGTMLATAILALILIVGAGLFLLAERQNRINAVRAGGMRTARTVPLWIWVLGTLAIVFGAVAVVYATGFLANAA